MNDIKESFGARVREIRNCAGLSQEQLAQLSKLRKENISKLENGNFNVTLNTIDKLSVAFKLPHKEFFDFSSPMTEKKNTISLHTPHPFVKWAGGKKQLLEDIKLFIPKEFNTYFEPFIGGGALLFDITPQRAVINDFNSELIKTYRCFCDEAKFNALKELLKKHEESHNDEYYYQVRELDRSEDFQNLTDPEIAARFIYLNKSCFNGLYRVNSKGFFNVPSGRKTKVKTYDNSNFNSIFEYFKHSELKFLNEDFQEAVKTAEEGDFVYFDPPYDPIENKNSFTSYSKDGFGKEEQIRLRDTFSALTAKGVKVLLSNHNTSFIREIYSDYDINVVKAVRAINSDASGRGKIEEVLIKNY